MLIISLNRIYFTCQYLSRWCLRHCYLSCIRCIATNYLHPCLVLDKSPTNEGLEHLWNLGVLISDEPLHTGKFDVSLAQFYNEFVSGLSDCALPVRLRVNLYKKLLMLLKGKLLAARKPHSVWFQSWAFFQQKLSIGIWLKECLLNCH